MHFGIYGNNVSYAHQHQHLVTGEEDRLATFSIVSAYLVCTVSPQGHQKEVSLSLIPVIDDGDVLCNDVSRRELTVATKRKLAFSWHSTQF